MRPTIRTLLTSLVIATVAPIGLAALDLEQPAFAKNGGGNGGGNGNAGGNGKGGNGKSSEAGQNKGSQAKANGKFKSLDTELTDDESLKPSALGKLNGVLHASPTAIANASLNSPIGTARAFGDALADFLDSFSSEEPTGDEQAATEDDSEPVDIDQLGEMMARMTNKPVTAEQVEAVAEKLGIETEEEATDEDAPTGDEATGDETASDETAGDEPSDEDDAPTLDPDTAQAIADKANEIHGFTDDTAEGDDGVDDGDSAETITN